MEISVAPMWRAIGRVQPRLAAVVISGVCYVAGNWVADLVVGPSEARAMRMFRRWSRKTCARFGLQSQVDGNPPAESCVYVSNHRSYLDIPLLAGTLDATFLSRADVGTWPVVGAAARATGVVFVERDDPHARVRAARALARRLRSASVIVFPEGTTRGDRLPGPFFPGLFRLLRRLSVPIVPVTIRYDRRDAYWVDDVSLSEHLRMRVLSGPPLKACVHIGKVIAPCASKDGDALAAQVLAAVSRPIEELGELVGEIDDTPVARTGS